MLRFRWTTSKNELDSHDERDKYTLTGYVHYCRGRRRSHGKKWRICSWKWFCSNRSDALWKDVSWQTVEVNVLSVRLSSYHLCLCESWGQNLNEIRFRSDVYKMLSELGKSAPYAIPDTKFDNFSEREFEEKVATSIILRLMVVSLFSMIPSVSIGRFLQSMPISQRKIRSMRCWTIRPYTLKTLRSLCDLLQNRVVLK